MIFIDGSGFTKHIVCRRGRSRVGKIAKQIQKTSKGTRMNVCVAIYGIYSVWINVVRLRNVSSVVKRQTTGTWPSRPSRTTTTVHLLLLYVSTSVMVSYLYDPLAHCSCPSCFTSAQQPLLAELPIFFFSHPLHLFLAFHFYFASNRFVFLPV